MNEIVIRIIDPALVKSLEERAAAHDTDVSHEAERLLQFALGNSSRGFDRVADAVRIAAMTPPSRVQTDSTVMVRQDRDRHL